MWNALDLGVELVIEGILGVWCGGKGWGIGTNDVDVPGSAGTNPDNRGQQWKEGMRRWNQVTQRCHG